MPTPFDLGFDIIDLGRDEEIGANIRTLLEQGHELSNFRLAVGGMITCMVEPGVEVKNAHEVQ